MISFLYNGIKVEEHKKVMFDIATMQEVIERVAKRMGGQASNVDVVGYVKERATNEGRKYSVFPQMTTRELERMKPLYKEGESTVFVDCHNLKIATAYNIVAERQMVVITTLCPYNGWKRVLEYEPAEAQPLA